MQPERALTFGFNGDVTIAGPLLELEPGADPTPPPDPPPVPSLRSGPGEDPPDPPPPPPPLATTCMGVLVGLLNDESPPVLPLSAIESGDGPELPLPPEPTVIGYVFAPTGYPVTYTIPPATPPLPPQ